MKTYLGRPWRDYAHTVFAASEITDVVRPEGWHNWNRPEREATTRYSEVRNTGAGAATARRVSWMKPVAESDLPLLTPANVLRGNDGWDPSSVPSSPSARKALDVAIQ